MKTVGIIGASGFIGSATRAALLRHGYRVQAIRAPRLVAHGQTLFDMRTQIADMSPTASLAREIEGCDCVVNAAGISDSTASGARLVGANSLLPALVEDACRVAMVPRFIHVSSSSVQGDRNTLDASRSYSPFSPYTRSKTLGEQLLGEAPGTVIFRPTSVHGHDRAVTQTLAAFASTRAACVPAPGDRPTPQVLITNVADALRHLSTTTQPIPSIVLQPNEGLTTASVLHALGGKTPKYISLAVSLNLIKMSSLAAKTPRTQAYVRRLTMLWFGQAQTESWLTATGWSPPDGLDEWTSLGVRLQKRSAR